MGTRWRQDTRQSCSGRWCGGIVVHRTNLENYYTTHYNYGKFSLTTSHLSNWAQPRIQLFRRLRTSIVFYRCPLGEHIFWILRPDSFRRLTPSTKRNVGALAFQLKQSVGKCVNTAPSRVFYADVCLFLADSNVYLVASCCVLYVTDL